jgi:hypothetical protein
MMLKREEVVVAYMKAYPDIRLEGTRIITKTSVSNSWQSGNRIGYFQIAIQLRCYCDSLLTDDDANEVPLIET